MANTKLEQILSNPLWVSNGQLNTVRGNYISNNSMYNQYNVQSRTLREVLSYTIGYYGNSDKAFQTLALFYNLLTKSNLKIYTGYRLIGSDEANNLNINNILINDFTLDTNTTPIFLYHIPKGKSYLRKVLDETEDLQRLRQIEVLCIENTQHFLRVYKNFPGTGINSITVFSDMYTKTLIQMLFIMLPNILELNPIQHITDTPLTEEHQTYNTRIENLRTICSMLYDISRADMPHLLYETEQLTPITTVLKNAMNNFINSFDFVSEQLNSFTQHLASAKNRNAIKYYTNELNKVVNQISRLESELQQAYNAKHNAEREIIMNKTVTEDDVKPLIDTIKNTKAIEILSTTEREMTLRITVPLQYFTPEDFEAYEKNATSEYNRGFTNMPHAKKVLHKIFNTREYKMIAQGVINMRINTEYNSSPLSLNAINDTSRYTEFPNPHLYHYNCWAKAQSEIQKNVCEGNFELVVMQMVAAVQTVNIAESASFTRGLLYDILNTGLVRKITILDKNNNKMSWTEALELEKQLEKENKIKEAIQTLEENKQEYTQVEIPDNDSDWETIVTNVGPNPEHTYENFEEGEDEDEED